MSTHSQSDEDSVLAFQAAVKSGPEQVKMALSDENPAAGLLECGVDEVGIGSAIAEVYAAACILDPSRRINGLRDSKQLTPERRKELSDRIKERALDFCIATASLEEINQLNVFGATMLAMQRAVGGLKLKPGIVLIDGNRLPKLPFPARTIVKGDAKVRVISAASILAKVARDEAMLIYHKQFPHYGFAENKGYLTQFHLASLKQFGPCPVHRKNYEPIRILLSPAGPEQQLKFITAELHFPLTRPAATLSPSDGERAG
ncbi:MAG: ribonuclease HII [Verrucomicrobiota bacterium]|jgi:ribonuclease HII